MILVEDNTYSLEGKVLEYFASKAKCGFGEVLAHDIGQGFSSDLDVAVAAPGTTAQHCCYPQRVLRDVGLCAGPCSLLEQCVQPKAC